MKIIGFIIFCSTITCIAQNKTFIDSGKTYQIQDKYFVNEITLKHDSTYTQRYYTFKDKNQTNNYRNLKPKLESSGTFSKKEKYYIFNEITPNDFVIYYFKISDKKLIYLIRKNNFWKKGAKFKLSEL